MVSPNLVLVLGWVFTVLKYSNMKKKKFKQPESSTLVHICWYCGVGMLNEPTTINIHETKYCKALVTVAEKSK